MRLVGLIGLALILPAGSAQAATTIKTESAASPISAARGVAMWSTLSTTDGLYHLRLYSNGVVRDLGVSPRSVPFDVNVGIDENRQTVAVYSRCRSERADRVNADACSLFEYDLRSGKEERLRGLTPRGASTFLPAVDGRNLAYVAVGENGAQANPRVYLVDRTTRRRTRVAAGPRGNYQLGSDGFYNGPTPTALDLSGRRIALIWRHFTSTCADSEGEYQPLTDILLTTAGGQAHSVASTGCNERTPLGGLALTSGSVFYLRHETPDAALRRYDYTKQKTTVAAGYGESQSIAGGPNQLFDVRYRPELGSWAVTMSTPAFTSTG